MGNTVTAISTSPNKEAAAREIGADKWDKKEKDKNTKKQKNKKTRGQKDKQIKRQKDKEAAAREIGADKWVLFHRRFARQKKNNFEFF